MVLDICEIVLFQKKKKKLKILKKILIKKII